MAPYNEAFFVYVVQLEFSEINLKLLLLYRKPYDILEMY